jgi:tyrosinase
MATMTRTEHDGHLVRHAAMVDETMVSFPEMLRMLDPEILHRIKLPHWFPAVRKRKDQAALKEKERERFLCAYQTLIGTGTLGQFVKIHGQVHYQHGTQRFLPWHRIFLIVMEQALETVHPEVTIPYWDWTQASEQTFPAWLAGYTPTVTMPAPLSPITVTRSPGTQSDLATLASNIPTIEASSDFSTFTGTLEAVHGGVHGWVGGTMSWISTAPCDPIFWMHHANIDRLWWEWQGSHPGENPNLTGTGTGPTSSVMDPWAYTEADTRDISALGYEYV